MASNKSIQERVKELVAEVLAEENSDRRPENINDIEEAMIRIGDMVAREFGVQKIAARTQAVEPHPPCPHCGHAEEEVMPEDSCQFEYECRGCKALLRGKAGACCVFCTYGSMPCPPVSRSWLQGGCCEAPTRP